MYRPAGAAVHCVCACAQYQFNSALGSNSFVLRTKNDSHEAAVSYTAKYGTQAYDVFCMASVVPKERLLLDY